MGSNSFHCLVEEYQSGEKQQLYCAKSRVRLMAGFDANGRLSEAVIQKALTILREFAEELTKFGPLQLRVVGTKALRQAINSSDFLTRVQGILGVTPDVIDGLEEARLIYQGVSTTIPETVTSLVIDVGGGSTEFIVGKGSYPEILDSLSLGCLVYQQQFFPEGEISEGAYVKARTQARLDIYDIRSTLLTRKLTRKWQQVIGCSGCFESLFQIQQVLFLEKGFLEKGYSETEVLTISGIKLIEQKLLEFNSSHDIRITGLDDERRLLLPAALAIVSALFDLLSIEEVQISNAALKEGIIVDLQDEREANLQREQAVLGLMQQYRVDKEHAYRVLTSVSDIWSQLSNYWTIEPHNLLVLSWAALLHEIGLSISPHDYHLHGSYLIANTEIPGFTRGQQSLLACLIAGQKGVVPTDLINELPEIHQNDAGYLLRILRLAKIIRANREISPPTRIEIKAEGSELHLSMLPSTHKDVELLWAGLIREIDWQKQAGYSTSLQGNLQLTNF